MSVKWTTHQQEAIDANGCNTLVSAAAGSGKTAVLVERVIKKITDVENPVAIDKLLICTFTNAAASGMQLKIREAIKKQLDASPDNEHLAKQLTLFPRAAITTVHSFCQTLLRNNFHKAGISASFEIGDETQLSILRNQALEAVLEESCEKAAPAFEALVGGFGGKRDDSTLAELILDIYNFTQSTAEPFLWLEEAKSKFYNDGIRQWTDYIISSIGIEFHGMCSAYDNAIRVIELGNGIAQYLDNFCAEREMLSSLANEKSASWNEMRELISKIKFNTLPRKDKDADESAVSYVQDIRKRVKTQIDKIRAMLGSSEEDIEQDNIILGGIITELCGIVNAFAEQYSLLKREKNLVDFNDLEHLTLKLLQDDEIKKDIQSRYTEVLVDEYQDTNGVQEAIFKAVSRGDNLFMVGDVKQSIYGFRNAQPQIFTEKAKVFGYDQGIGSLITLAHNFRSCPGIIKFVNEIFSNLMSEGMGGVDYSDGHSLISGAEGIMSENVATLHIIEKQLEESDDLTDEELLSDEILREAMFTARQIVSLVESEKPMITDSQTGERRALRYSDIAILTRKIKGVSSVFAQELSRVCVPFYCEDEMGDFVISPEISTVLSFLQITDNPLQDIPLLAVMRSPMFSFSDEELAKIRSYSDGCFYKCLCKCPSEKSKDFLNQLQKYKKLSQREGIENLIRTILSDTGYLSFVSLLPGGETRAANLRLLCERAGRFESGEYKSVFDFINYIAAMQEYSQSYSVAKIAGQNDDVVRMMSIHKSKGLEFPVVFMVRCGGMFNTSDLRAPVQYDLDMGIGCDFIDMDRGIKYPSVSKLAISFKKSFFLLSEEMRVMYVAMTRARDYLYIVGSCKNLEKKLTEWENSDVNPYTVSKQKTYLDWIGLALSKKIRSIAKVHNAVDIVLAARESISIQQSFFDDGDAEECYSDEVAKRLEYVYPYSNARFIPSKLPVSQAILDAQRKIKLKKPDFVQRKERLSAAARGTIIHFVLQNIDLKRTSSKEEIKMQLDEMILKGMIDRELADVVSEDSLAEFFASDIGKRMRASKKVLREVKFFIDIPARDILIDIDDSVANENVLLQGVVDCCFEEDGELVIIDYKTGSAERPEYQKQLEFYAKGLSRSLNMPVRETLLYPLI